MIRFYLDRVNAPIFRRSINFNNCSSTYVNTATVFYCYYMPEKQISLNDIFYLGKAFS